MGIASLICGPGDNYQAHQPDESVSRGVSVSRGRAQPPGLPGMLRIVEPNLAECMLCELCVQAGPGEVRVVDSYE